MIEETGISVTLKAELDRFERKMRDAGRLVETTTSGMDKSTKRAARAFEQLEGKLDPASRALVRLERDTAKVQRAVDKGAISTDRAAQVQRRLNDQYEQAIARINGVAVAQRQMAAASAVAGRSSARFGGAIQNSAYQVGDFAVQVAAGTNATRALAMQLPQLLGGFGVIGAVVGGAVAVIGALVSALWETEEASDAAEDALSRVEKANKAIADSQKALLVSLGGDIDDLAEKYRGLGEAAREVERTNLTAALRAQQNALATLRQEAAGDVKEALPWSNLRGLERRFPEFGEMLAGLESGRGADPDEALSRFREMARELRASGNPTVLAAAGHLDAAADALGEMASKAVAAKESIAEYEAALAAANDEAARTPGAMRWDGKSAFPHSADMDALLDRRRQRELFGSTAGADSVVPLPGSIDASGFGGAGYEDALVRADRVQREATASMREMGAEAARIWEQTRTPLELYSAEMMKLNALLEAGAINQETYGRAAMDAAERYNAATAESVDHVRRLDSAIANAGQGFQMFGQMADQALGTIQMRAGDVTSALIDLGRQLLQIVLATAQRGGSFGFAFDSLIGGFSTGPSSSLGSLQMMTKGYAGGLGFADGGSFMVSDAFPRVNAGRDNRLVSFFARDGETVDVRKPGQSGGGGGDTFIINAPGATAETVEALRQTLYQWAGPGKVEQRSVNAVAMRSRRDPNFLRR